MLDMRLRLPELMNREGSEIRTAYALARETGLSTTNAYHMVKARGRVLRIELATIEALCVAFGVSPNQLLERDEKPDARPLVEAAVTTPKRPRKSPAKGLAKKPRR